MVIPAVAKQISEIFPLKPWIPNHDSTKATCTPMKNLRQPASPGFACELFTG